MLRQWTAVFLVLSFLLWVLSNYFGSLCETNDRVRFSPPVPKRASDPPSKEVETPHHNIKDIWEWITGNAPNDYVNTKPFCHSAVDSQFENITGNWSGVLTVTVLGAINLNATAVPHLSFSALDELLLQELSEQLLLDDSDITLSNFISPVSGEVKTVTKWMKTARDFGLSLLSLANQHILEEGKAAAGNTAHICETADIRWVGLNAKSHEILKFNGVKIGFLAFCGLFGSCIETASLPFTPARYTTKAATAAVQELQQHGVDSIVVVIYWGREYSYFPDETALYAARHLAELKVDVIVGYHPHLMQDHAYFGNTLVIFSPGYFLSSDHMPPFCWERLSASNWRYKSSDHCLMVHPSIRQSLLDKELQTRVYRISIHMHGSGPAATARYITLPLELHKTTNMRRPSTLPLSSPDENRNQQKEQNRLTLPSWIGMCSDEDYHCLSCKPF